MVAPSLVVIGAVSHVQACAASLENLIAKVCPLSVLQYALYWSFVIPPLGDGFQNTAVPVLSSESSKQPLGRKV
jgi:hypothetical protein